VIVSKKMKEETQSFGGPEEVVRGNQGAQNLESGMRRRPKKRNRKEKNEKLGGLLKPEEVFPVKKKEAWGNVEKKKRNFERGGAPKERKKPAGSSRGERNRKKGCWERVKNAMGNPETYRERLQRGP